MSLAMALTLSERPAARRSVAQSSTISFQSNLPRQAGFDRS